MSLIFKISELIVSIFAVLLFITLLLIIFHYLLVSAIVLLITYVSSVIILFGIRYFYHVACVWFKKKSLRERTFSGMKIQVVEDIHQCQDMCKTLRKSCTEIPVLGFDCEWVSYKGHRNPIALLQLASSDGNCGLYRLNKLGEVPVCLRNLLSNDQIYKLGVATIDDAFKLNTDYGAIVNSCVDLRNMDAGSGGGLAALALEVLGVVLNKSRFIAASDWEDEILSDDQLIYAAKDAFVSMQIFKMWLLNHAGSGCSKYADIYNQVHDKLVTSKDLKPPKIKEQNINSRPPVKKIATTRQTPLYDNCYMFDPNGKLLCSCDHRKAEWYVSKGLAEVIPGEIFSIRLKFQPKDRGGDADDERFYSQLKQNHCVVCGKTDSYVKNYVVPREYRQYFPNIMKDHQSHDIVLTCESCHLEANQFNQILKEKLAKICDAPFLSKTTDLQEARKVQSAVRALVKSGNVIPEGRKVFLESVITDYFGEDKITEKLLQEAMSIETKSVNTDYVSHNRKVYEYYSKRNELMEFEKMWRTYFLTTMQPKFLPALWSVNHNHERLRRLGFNSAVSPSQTSQLRYSYTSHDLEFGLSPLESYLV